MRRGDTHDVVVVGAGSAGLTAAGGLAQLGLNVALVERAVMGGECLTAGCVPSKALLAAARRARDMREAAEVGVEPASPTPDLARAMAHVRAAQAAIAPHDSQARYEAWGAEDCPGDGVAPQPPRPAGTQGNPTPEQRVGVGARHHVQPAESPERSITGALRRLVIALLYRALVNPKVHLS